MSWISASLSILALAIALSVFAYARAINIRLTVCCAQLAADLSKCSRGAQAKDLTASQLVELAQVSDAVAKGNALLKRINSRETMRDRRIATEDAPPVDPAALKAYLRRKAGLTAGKPAPHHETAP